MTMHMPAMQRSSTLPAIVDVSSSSSSLLGASIPVCGLSRSYSGQQRFPATQSAHAAGAGVGAVVFGMTPAFASYHHHHHHGPAPAPAPAQPAAVERKRSSRDEWEDVADLDDVLDWFSSEGSSSVEEGLHAMESCLLDLFEAEPESQSSSACSSATCAPMLSSSASADLALLPALDLCAQLTKEQQRLNRQRCKARWLEKRKRQRAAAAFKSHYPDRREAAKGRKRVGGKFAREGPVFLTMEELERRAAEFGAAAG